jgi:uncharacterized protein (TIGR02246 family)
MRRNTSLTVCLALAALTAACSNPPAPPPDTRAADVQAVKDVEAAWVKDTSAKDVDKWVSYFADDGCALYPGSATLCGKSAIKTAMAPYFGDRNFSLSFQSTKVVASKGSDMVYAEGTYTSTATNPKTKKPMNDKGKYLTIYMKQADGTWKVVVDTYNSDSPM